MGGVQWEEKKPTGGTIPLQANDYKESSLFLYNTNFFN